MKIQNAEKYTGLFMVLFFLLMYAGCKSKETPENKTDTKIKISVSVPTYKGITEKVGGSRVEVSCLLPPGFNPPEFDPTPAVLKKASQTDLYIRVSEDFEFENVWLRKIKTVKENLNVFNSSEGVIERDHNHHIWNGTEEVKIIAGNIFNKLAELDSVNVEFYKMNYDYFMKEIDSVDVLVREKLAGIKQNTIITYHPAWTYFTNSYGLNQIAIEDHGRQPNANDLARLVKKAKKLGIKAVFIQPQFDNNTAKIIANEIGAELVEIDPLPEDFLANIVDITNKIVKYNE